MKKIRPLLALVFIVVLLSSCVGIDSRLTIRDNGSARLVLSYRISRQIVDTEDTADAAGSIPLPISKADFQRGIADVHGARLVGFSRKDGDKDIAIRAEISFDSVDSLSKVRAFSDASPRFSVEGERRTYSQLIAHAMTETVTDDSQRMLDSLFEGYGLSWTIEAPRRIKEHSLGTLSADGRTLTYSTSVKEAVMSKSDVLLSLSW